MRRSNLLIILLLWLFVACSPSASPSTSLQVPGVAKVNAEATINTANAIIDVTRAAAVSQTAIALEATQIAEASQTAIALEATQIAEATSGALEVQATEAALAMVIAEATREAAFIAAEGTRTASGTATAVSATVTAEEAREAERIANVQMIRMAEADRLETVNYWNGISRRLWTGVPIALIIAILVFTFAILNRLNHLNKRPVEAVESPGAPTVFIVHSLTGSEIRRIGSGNGSPRLPAPTDPDPVPLLPSPVRDLPALDDGHIMIAGPTGSGKSTASRFFVLERAKRPDHSVIVLDPHNAPGDWGSATVIGGGGNYDAIGDQFGRITDELYSRMQQRNDHNVREFPPMTIATDELRAIVRHLGRDASEFWGTIATEGRKFFIYLIVSTQSTTVKALGIEGEGDLRENFKGVLLLGGLATKKHSGLVEGMGRPAVWETPGQGAVPVIVPNVRPVNPDTLPVTNADPLPPVIIDPEADPAVMYDKIYTPEGDIEPETIAEIIKWRGRLPSAAAVERRVYGYSGGAAYNKVNAVITRYGHLVI